MPFKFNATRRHHIPKARYRVRNWAAYEAGLRRRGDLTLWIDEAALDLWQAPPRSTPGGQAIYSDLAIEMVLMLRTVFHLALRRRQAVQLGVGELELKPIVPRNVRIATDLGVVREWRDSRDAGAAEGGSAQAIEPVAGYLCIRIQ
jgi:hypothetical protein